MPLASLGSREAGQPFPMLRSHNYTHYIASSSNPRSNPRYSYSQAHKLDSDDVSTEALIPNSESTGESVRTRRAYSGIHCAANMKDDVIQAEKVGKPIKERRTSHGRGGIGNMRRPSEGIIVEKTVDGEGNTRWRRTSVWSQSDEKAAQGRRASIVKFANGLFGRKGSVSEVAVVDGIKP